MSKHNDGGPAFPSENKHGQIDGITMRDYFAAKAMHGMLEKSYEWSLTFDDVADYAYMVADIMLAVREEGE